MLQEMDNTFHNHNGLTDPSRVNKVLPSQFCGTRPDSVVTGAELVGLS